jgi:hypothetical protein
MPDYVLQEPPKLSLKIMQGVFMKHQGRPVCRHIENMLRYAEIIPRRYDS